MKKARRYLALLLATALLSSEAIPVYAETDTYNSDAVQEELGTTAEETSDYITAENNDSESEVFAEKVEGQIADPFRVQAAESQYSIASFFAEAYTGCYGDQLESYVREIYEALAANYADKNHFGELDIEFKKPIFFKATMEGDSLVKDEEYERATSKVNNAVQAASDAFAYDYPELYWMRGGRYEYNMTFSVDGDNWEGCISYVRYISEETYSDAHDRMDEFKEEVENVKNSLIKQSSNARSRYALVKQIHDYVCDTAYYNMVDSDQEDYLKVHSAEPIFMGDGGVVCEGYAKAVKILCDELEIPCALVSGGARGKASEAYAAHMWNYVQMTDGNWYLLDATWDDQDTETYYNYFLAGADSQGFYIPISEERNPNPDFSDTGIQLFTYPVLSETAYEPSTEEIPEVEAPEQVVISKISGKSDRISLTWEEIDDADKYEIYMATSKDGKFSKIKTVPSSTLSYTKKELSEGKTYYFKVRACKMDGEKKVSGKFSDIKAGATSPGTPSIVSLKGQDKSITVKWSQVTGASEYAIYMSSSSNGKYNKIATASSKKTSYKVTGLSANKNYYFKIRAYRKADMNTAYSSYSGVNYTGTATETPSISSIDSQRKKLTIKWNKVSGADRYEVYMASSSNGEYTKVATVKSTNTSYTKSGLKDGTTYYFKIRTFRSVNNGKVYSNYSKVKSKKTVVVYYVTPTGKCYHRESCATTKNSKNLKEISLSDAKKKGYTACKVCKP